MFHSAKDPPKHSQDISINDGDRPSKGKTENSRGSIRADTLQSFKLIHIGWNGPTVIILDGCCDLDESLRSIKESERMNYGADLRRIGRRQRRHGWKLRYQLFVDRRDFPGESLMKKNLGYEYVVWISGFSPRETTPIPGPPSQKR